MTKPSNDKIQRILLDSMLTEYEIDDRKNDGTNEGVKYGLESAERYKQMHSKQRRATTQDRDFSRLDS